MTSSLIPLAAVAAANTVSNVMNHNDPLGGAVHDGAHARTIKANSASGGIAGFNPG